MDTSGSWEELSTLSHRKCPKIFYKFAVVDDGYELQLTDITALWVVKSNSAEILEYARVSKASIDPAESQSQLKVLCDKLRESIAGGANTLKKDESTNSETVLLCTSLELPRPLPPLKWNFLLEPKGALDLAENILKPCLHEASASLKKIESLCKIVEAKDRAIERLLEKIESSSIDLSLVFPGITGVKARKGQVTIKEAQKHVPGLAKFQPREWSRIFDSQSQYSGFEASGLAKLVTGNERCPKHTPEQHQKWYERLPKATSTMSQVAKSAWIRSSSPVRQESEDEFETQKRSHLARRALPTAIRDLNTESEEERPRKKVKTTLRGRNSSNIVHRLPSSPKLPSSPPMLQRGPTNPTSSPFRTASESELELDVRQKTENRLGALGRMQQRPENPVSIRLDRALPSSSSLAAAQSSLHSRSSTSSVNDDEENGTKEDNEDAFEDIQMIDSPTKSRYVNQEGSSHAVSAELTTQRRSTHDESVNSSQTTPSRRRLGMVSGRTNHEPDSTQTTPSNRRLGRVGNRASQPDTGQRRLFIPDINETNGEKGMVEDNADPDRTASPASTVSAVSSSSPEKQSGLSLKPALNQEPSVKAESNSTPDQSDPESEPSREETQAEKLARRREERRHLDTSIGNGSSSGVGGIRKKRKF